MKTVYLLAVSFILSLIVSSPASAKIFIKGGVQQIYVGHYNANRIYIRIKDDTCLASGKYYYIDRTDPSAQDMYSMLLTAAHSKTEVTLRLSSEHTSCPIDSDGKIYYVLQNF